jgi:hypothetical protein
MCVSLVNACLVSAVSVLYDCHSQSYVLYVSVIHT